jgi:DNA-binding SARP family transcriptional activator
MLEATLLGQFFIRVDGAVITQLIPRPAQALLAYLLLNPGIPHRRGQLAGLLWPASPENAARKNLRNAVWQLRRAIGEHFLAAEKETVALDPAAPTRLDTAQLADEAVAGDTDALLRAVAAYRGELLPGFDADWVQLERVRVRGLFGRRMQTLLERLMRERRWLEVQTWAEHWIALGHVPEPAYRALMLAHAAGGDQAGMALAYRRCIRALAEELSVSPSAETHALYQQLSRSGQVTRETLSFSLTPTPAMAAGLPG